MQIVYGNFFKKKLEQATMKDVGKWVINMQMKFVNLA